ncbi:MAG: hypothetical protein JWP08_1660, partial [Bryobacterales bacterium]|nr:hypothetical protein [Bryobacterales bacterium]
MKGIVLADTRTVEVREVPDAEIKQSTNVLMRGTSTAICGPTFTSLKAECPMAVISLATNLWALWRKWEARFTRFAEAIGWWSQLKSAAGFLQAASADTVHHVDNAFRGAGAA